MGAAMHPFEHYSADKRRRAFIWLLAGTLLVGAALVLIDSRMHSAAAPHGIVSYELARNVDAAQKILDSWTTLRARGAAGMSLGLDFLFLALYSSLIALACLWAGQRAGFASALGKIAGPLAWAQWLAASLDAVENVALAIMFDRIHASEPLRSIAFVAAALKFGLVALGLGYSALGCFVRPSGKA